MTAPTCTACDNPAQSGCTLCRSCERRTSHHLGDMESHREELTTAMARQAVFVAQSDGGKSAANNLDWQRMGERYLDSLTPGELERIRRGLPPQPTAAELLHDQRAVLSSWCRLINEEIDHTWPRRDTIRAMSLHIESRLPELRKHEAAGELAHEVADLVRRIMACIDKPADRARINVGPCPQVLEDQGCSGQVVAVIPHDNEVRPVIKCGSCGSEWLAEQWARLGRTIQQRKESA